MPIILGCGGCGLLLVLGIVAALLIGGVMKKRQHGGTSAGDTTAVSAEDMAGTKLYTSSEEGLNETLRPHFVPFSFRYPEDWRMVEDGTDPANRNFVKVEKQANDITQENFAVGYMFAPPGREDDPDVLRQLISQFETQFAQQFPGYQRTGDDHTTIAGREATGFRFTARQNNIDIYGRFLVLPVGQGKGLSIIMLGTPVGSGLHSVDELGEKGGIPVILRTFRVGESAASGSEAASDTPNAAEDTTAAAAGTEGKPSEKPSDEEQPPAEDTLPQIRRIEPINP